MHTFNHRDGQHLDIDGARIYVEEQGNPDGPALLFLPGGFDQIETWNLLMPGLAATHRPAVGTAAPRWARGRCPTAAWKRT